MTRSTFATKFIMRAVVVHEFTEYTNLEVEDVPPPSTPGEGELILDIHASGVSFATHLMVSGRYQRKPPLPFTPGAEVAGIVTVIGPGVSRFKPGDRVVAALDWGGWAEQALAKEVTCYPLPDGVKYAQAIGMVLSYATSYASLLWKHGLQLEADDTLLVHGAAGGVGIAALEIGRIVEATVIATVSTEEKAEIARAHGANHVIVSREPDFRDEVMALTNGRGVDKVYDPVGGEHFMQSLRCMAAEGRIIPIGFACGTIPQIPANLLLIKNLAVCGLNYGYYIGWSPYDARYESEERLRSLMTQLFEWTLDGKMAPTVAGTFPLSQFKDALGMVLARKAIGRVAILPQQID